MPQQQKTPDNVVMPLEKLGALVGRIAEGLDVNPADYTTEQIAWILGHLAEINEWVANEKRIGEIIEALSVRRAPK